MSGLARYPDIDIDFKTHRVIQWHMFSRDGQQLSFKGIEILVSDSKLVANICLEYSEFAPTAESRVLLTGGGGNNRDDNACEDSVKMISH